MLCEHKKNPIKHIMVYIFFFLFSHCIRFAVYFYEHFCQQIFIHFFLTRAHINRDESDINIYILSSGCGFLSLKTIMVIMIKYLCYAICFFSSHFAKCFVTPSEIFRLVNRNSSPPARSMFSRCSLPGNMNYWVKQIFSCWVQPRKWHQ